MSLPLPVHIVVDPSLLSVFDPLFQLINSHKAVMILIDLFYYLTVDRKKERANDPENFLRRAHKYVVRLFLPQSLFALLWRELVKSLCLLLSEKSLVVVVKVLLIIVLLVAEGGVVMDALLLLHGFAGGVKNAEGDEQERQQVHLLVHFNRVKKQSEEQVYINANICNIVTNINSYHNSIYIESIYFM